VHGLRARRDKGGSKASIRTSGQDRGRWDTYSRPRRIARTCRTGSRIGAGHLREPSNPLHHVCRKFAFSAFGQHGVFSSKDESRLTVESERISYAVTREIVPWLHAKRPFGKLTMRDLNKLILRAWLMILVGVVFTTETFVCLLYVLFRRRLIHYITKAKSSTLFYRRRNASYAQSRTLYRSAALTSTAHASNARRIKSELMVI